MTTTAGTPALGEDVAVAWEPQAGPQTEAVSCPLEDAFMGGHRGGGKGLRLSEPIATPYGFRPIGDLKVGSRICNAHGGNTQVIGVYDRGLQPFYRLTFNDGAQLDTDGDHIWLCRIYNSRSKQRTQWRKATTAQLYERLQRMPHARIMIPLAEPVQFTRAYNHDIRRLDPYVLGALLGDGTLTGSGVRFSTADEFLAQAVGAAVDGTVTHYSGYDYGIRGPATKRELIRLGVWGKRSWEKSVPAPYKLGTAETRLAVLQGLLDTDGTVSKTGKLSFTSTSRALAGDVQWLARSLGARARLSARTTQCAGKPGRESYRVVIAHADKRSLFRLARKRDRCPLAFNGGTGRIGRRIVAIEAIEPAESRCIAVDSPDGLFVASEAFVVTHNTDYLLGNFAIRAAKYGADAKGIIFRKTYPDLDEILSRSHEIYPRLGARFNVSEGRYPGRTWIFPNGATLKLRYLERLSDADKYEGHEYTDQYFDQVEKWLTPAPVDKLWGSLRSSAGVPCIRRCTGNPPAPLWVRERYIDPAPPGMPFRYRPQPELRPDLFINAVYIPARLEDNIILQQEDPGYEDRLAAAGDEALFRAWRYGDWEAMIGQVFKEWRSSLHVIPRFEVPQGWILAAGLDWGYRNPGAFGLFASGPDGDCVMVRELVFKETYAEEVGYKVGLICQHYGLVDYIACDNQMWQRSGVTAPTVAEEFQAGLWKAYQDDREKAPRVLAETKTAGNIGTTGYRAAKLQLMHRYLAWKEAPDPKNPGKRIVPPWGRPRLRFTRDCEYSIRTIPLLPYDESKPEDVDTEADDHAYDMVCAYLMSRPPLPAEPVREPGPDEHPGLTKRGKRRKWEEALQEPTRPARAGWRVPREYEPIGEW